MHRHLWWLSKSPRRHGKKMSKWLHLNKFKSNQENQIPVICFKLIYPMNDWITLRSRTYIYFVNMKKEERGFDVIPFISDKCCCHLWWFPGFYLQPQHIFEETDLHIQLPGVIYSGKFPRRFKLCMPQTEHMGLPCKKLPCNWSAFCFRSRIPILSASWPRNPGFIFVFANQLPRSMDSDPEYLCVWPPYSYLHIHCHDLHSSPCNLVSRLLN